MVMASAIARSDIRFSSATSLARFALEKLSGMVRYLPDLRGSLGANGEITLMESSNSREIGQDGGGAKVMYSSISGVSGRVGAGSSHPVTFGVPSLGFQRFPAFGRGLRYFRR